MSIDRITIQYNVINFHLAQIKEGEEFARWFNKLGVSAFVLYYRMPNGHHAIPLKDAQTAMSIIRNRAKEWKINKNKIGIMGFSAGGAFSIHSRYAF